VHLAIASSRKRRCQIETEAIIMHLFHPVALVFSLGKQAGIELMECDE
jgi:hypothetical protein